MLSRIISGLLKKDKVSGYKSYKGRGVRKERLELLNYYEFQVNFNNSTATISIPSNETITRNDLKHFTTNTNTTYSMPTYLPSSTTSTSINPIIKNNIIRSKRILSEIIKKFHEYYRRNIKKEEKGNVYWTGLV